MEATWDSGVRPADLERPRPVTSPWGRLALYRCGNDVFAAEAFCPHMLGPLFQGTVSGETVTCPWHHWRYDLRTGARVDAVPLPEGDEGRPLVTCAVEIGPEGTLVLHAPDRPVPDELEQA